MEGRDKTPTGRPTLEQVLSRVDENQLVEFTATGYRLYEYVKTNKIRTVGVQIGESEMIFKVPESEIIPSTEDISLPDPHLRSYYGPPYTPINSEDFRFWKEGLITPEAIKAAAIDELERRKTGVDEQFVTCTNCKGKMLFKIDCTCKEGGTVIVDMKEGTTESKREMGVPDPYCPSCKGSGEKLNFCQQCEGSGKNPKYPILILVNETTGEKRVLKFDLAPLIVSGDVEVVRSSYERQYENGTQRAETHLLFNVSKYIDRNMTELGIDKDNSVQIIQYGAREVWTENWNATGAAATWQKSENSIGEGHYFAKEDLTAAEVLDATERNLAGAHAWPTEKIRDENGALADVWTLRPLRPIGEVFEELKDIVEAGGFSLGFRMAFIATGEVGPSFYILDKRQKAESQISNSYTVRTSLENAWLTVQKLISEGRFSVTKG